MQHPAKAPQAHPANSDQPRWNAPTLGGVSYTQTNLMCTTRTTYMPHVKNVQKSSEMYVRTWSKPGGFGLERVLGIRYRSPLSRVTRTGLLDISLRLDELPAMTRLASFALVCSQFQNVKVFPGTSICMGLRTLCQVAFLFICGSGAHLVPAWAAQGATPLLV